MTLGKIPRDLVWAVDGNFVYYEQIPIGSQYYWNSTPSDIRVKTGPGVNDAKYLRNDKPVTVNTQSSNSPGYVIHKLPNSKEVKMGTTATDTPKYLVLMKDSGSWRQIGSPFETIDTAMTALKGYVQNSPSIPFMVIQPIATATVEVQIHELVKLNSDVYEIDE